MADPSSTPDSFRPERTSRVLPLAIILGCFFALFVVSIITVLVPEVSDDAESEGSEAGATGDEEPSGNE